MDPFAMALDAQFRAPGSMAATYTSAGEPALSIRTIRTTTTVDMQIGDKLLLAGSTVIQVRRQEIAQPLAGDTIDDGEPFIVNGCPTLDVEQITWSCEATPA